MLIEEKAEIPNVAAEISEAGFDRWGPIFCVP